MIKSIFSVDLRSIGVMRILIALLILIDLLQRATDLVAHYTDFGLLPRVAMTTFPYTRWHFSLHMLNGTWEVQALMFVVSGIAAIFLMIGYRTMLATFIVWLLVVSLANRNPIIVVGDTLLKSLLFWAMFLPWGARFSIDSVRARRHGGINVTPAHQFSGWPAVAFIVQILALFWFGVIQKSGVEWRSEGTALYYALSYEQFTTSIGLFLLQFPILLKLLTYMTFWAELIGPLLLIIPAWGGALRMAGVVMLVGLMVGIAVTMHIGLFLWVTSAALVGLMPSLFWTEACAWYQMHASSVATQIRRVTEFGVCQRLIRCFAASPIEPTLLSGSPTLRRARDVGLALLIGYVLLWNVATLPNSPVKFSERARAVGELVGLDQEWRMFAPSPPRDDGWYVIPGKLKNGDVVDLFNSGKPVTWAKPPLVSATFKTFRWQKYMHNIRSPSHADYRVYFGQYLCRDWNKRHPDGMRLQELELIYVLEITLPDFEYSTPEKVSIFRYRCDDSK